MIIRQNKITQFRARTTARIDKFKLMKVSFHHIIIAITSVGTDCNNVSESFSCLLNNSFYNKRYKSDSLSIDQPQSRYKNIKHVNK